MDWKVTQYTPGTTGELVLAQFHAAGDAYGYAQVIRARFVHLGGPVSAIRVYRKNRLSYELGVPQYVTPDPEHEKSREDRAGTLRAFSRFWEADL